MPPVKILLDHGSPFMLAHSVVPYQEILMLATLAFAFHFAFAARWPLASVCLGLACLTRYEAWIACPVLAVAYLRWAGVTPRTLLRAAGLFAWAPLLWIALNRGITPPGADVLEASVHPERLLRWAHLAATTLRNTPLPVLLLAANCPEWVVSFWAVARTGAVVAPGNGWWSEEEVDHVLSVIRPSLVIVSFTLRPIDCSTSARVIPCAESALLSTTRTLSSP